MGKDIERVRIMMGYHDAMDAALVIATMLTFLLSAAFVAIHKVTILMPIVAMILCVLAWVNLMHREERDILRKIVKHVESGKDLDADLLNEVFSKSND